MKKYADIIAVFVALALIIGAIFLSYYFYKSSQPAKIYGIDYSPFRDGQSPLTETYPSDDEIVQDLSILSYETKTILIYATTDFYHQIPKMANDAGLDCFAGAWLDSNPIANQNRIENLIEIGKSGYASTLIVGSEVLSRGDLSEEQLIKDLNLVKIAVPGVAVTYSNTPKELLAHPKIVKSSDFISANMYPFWEGVPIEKAVENINNDYEKLKTAYPDKEIVITETGWPSSGDSQKEAIASPENQARFLSEFVKWADDKNIKYFIFEAFDENWKSEYPDSPEKYWGLWQSDRTLKPEIEKFFKTGVNY